MEDDLADLSRTAPADFVAARNRLAKALRAAGRKDEAAAVATLRRPSYADWALNTVAVSGSDVVERAVAAFATLEHVQATAVGGSGGGGDLRAALRDAREAGAALRLAGESVLHDAGRADGDVTALAARVNELMANRALLDQLVAGRLGTAPVAEADPFASLPMPAVRRPARDQAPPQPSAKRRAVADRRGAKDERKEQEQKARDRQEHEERERQARLERRRRELREELAQAEAGVEAAQDTHERAVQALQDAQRRAARAHEELDAVRSRRDDAAVALAALDRSPD